MANTIHDFTIPQWGVESTSGTGVPATSKIVADEFQLTPIDEVTEVKRYAGLLVRNTGPSFISQRGVNWSIAGPLSYEQAPNLCSMFVKGGVSPSGGGPYVYTYDRSLAASPALNSWTLERRLSDGSSHKDEEVNYCIGQELTLSANLREAIRYQASGFGRRRQSSTLTAALSAPTVEIPQAVDSKVYIDSIWANLGVTQITGQILSWSLTFRSGAVPLYTMDGRSDRDYGTHSYDSEQVQVEGSITLLVAGQYDTEKTAAEAVTTRAVRLQVDGTSSRQIQIDMLLHHAMGSTGPIEVQDGQNIITMNFVETHDNSNFFKIKVTNNVAAMA